VSIIFYFFILKTICALFSPRKITYLVTGIELKNRKTKPPLAPDIQVLADIAGKLNPKNRRLAIKLVKVLKEQEDEGKK